MVVLGWTVPSWDRERPGKLLDWRLLREEAWRPLDVEGQQPQQTLVGGGKG